MVEPTGYTALDLIGFTDRGDFDSSEYYVKNDLVHDDDGNIWRVLIDDTHGVTPAEGLNYTIFIRNSSDETKRIIAPVETSPAAASHAVGTQLIYDGALYDVTTAIAANAALVVYPTSGYNIKPAATITSQLLSQKQALTNEAVTRSKVGAHNLLPMNLAWIKANNTSGTWSGDKYTKDNVEYTFNTDSNGNIISVLVNTIGTVSAQTSVTIALKDFGNSNLNAYELPTANGYTVSGGANVNSLLTIYYYKDTHSIRIIVNAGASISSKLIYPMIRLASDPNTEYEPYAMTNRELTEKSIGFPNYARVITTINTQGASYTPTENCWVNASLVATDAYMPQVHINNVAVAGISAQSYSNLGAIFMVPMKKGQTLTTRADHGQYNIVIYGCY